MLAGFLAVVFNSCYKNPVTGRSTLNLVDEGTMRQLASTEYVKYPKANGTPEALMVQRVGARMSAAVQQYLNNLGQGGTISGYQWEFNLIQNNEANAWCMPGGKVGVYTGILPVTQTEAGLAVVMGHEIAHAIARHGNERASQQMLAEGFEYGLDKLVGTNPTRAEQIFTMSVGAGGSLGLLKFSRDQESEADQMGLIFMAMAGYNPNEAVSFWERMAAKGGVKPPEFLSTHPADQRRIQDIRNKVADAMRYYKPQ